MQSIASARVVRVVSTTMRAPSANSASTNVPASSSVAWSSIMTYSAVPRSCDTTFSVAARDSGAAAVDLCVPGVMTVSPGTATASRAISSRVATPASRSDNPRPSASPSKARGAALPEWAHTRTVLVCVLARAAARSAATMLPAIPGETPATSRT